jgi:hypothetical protein
MKLPGHRPGASRKGNFIFIVPLGPTRAGAYGAPAGQYPRSPSVRINFFTPSITDLNPSEFDRDAGENLIAESSDRSPSHRDPNLLSKPQEGSGCCP